MDTLRFPAARIVNPQSYTLGTEIFLLPFLSLETKNDFRKKITQDTEIIT